MGERKRKRRLTQQVIEAFPFCIYCGGIEPATTADHFPPRAIFDLKRRPRGLEFPACASCNDGGRSDELVAALLSRCLPDGDSADKQNEMTKLFRSVRSRVPGLLEELQPSKRQVELLRSLGNSIPPGAGALNCQGPILNHAILRFAGKVGFALHYELTNQPIPATGGVCAWWYTNVNALKGEIPHNLLAILGDPSTLKQGQWSVSDQFGYASAAAETGAMSAHFATFRRSFAVVAFASTEFSELQPPEEVAHEGLFAPGWLASN